MSNLNLLEEKINRVIEIHNQISDLEDDKILNKLTSNEIRFELEKTLLNLGHPLKGIRNLSDKR